MLKQCAHCGQEFNAAAGQTKYCPACRKVAYREVHRAASLRYDKTRNVRRLARLRNLIAVTLNRDDYRNVFRQYVLLWQKLNSTVRRKEQLDETLPLV